MEIVPQIDVDASFHNQKCIFSDELHSARGADACLQISTNLVLQGGETLDVAGILENL